MTHADIILTLTGALAAAVILGFITNRLGLSPIVGYLLAGVVVGPHTPGFVADEHTAEELAHIGIILLMFGVGLHFHFHQLLAVRKVVVPGAIGQSLVTTLLGCFTAIAFGWSWQAGFLFGLALSIASTVVLLRVLADNQQLHSPIGHISVGWLVVEDISTVLVLVLLPVFFQANHQDIVSIALTIGWSILKIAILLGFILVVGGRLIPLVLEQVARSHSRELFTLTVLVVALGVAIGAARLFGASMELGAFLAGMIVGRSDFSSRAAADALPLRDAFAVLFFVSIGMLFNPVTVLEQPGLVGMTVLIVVVAKPLLGFLLVWFQGYSGITSLSVAILLGQIGEFSFILANLGRDLKILPAEATNALVATAILTISLNPLLYRCLNRCKEWVRRQPQLAAWFFRPLPGRPDPGEPDTMNLAEQHRVIVVGHGPIGQILVGLLQQNQFAVTLIELNVDTVRKLRTRGIEVIYGDALNLETLQQANCKSAIALILSSAAMDASTEVIQLARSINPKIQIFARAEFLQESSKLRTAGADAVFTSEGEVALAMTAFLLRKLGASQDQIQREQERVRSELFLEVDSGESNSTPFSIDPKSS